MASSVIHPDLAAWLARAGHHDLILVADAGFPVIRHVPTIYLGVTPGVVSFEQIMMLLHTVIVKIEGVWIARESQDQLVGRVLGQWTLPLQILPSHDALKQKAQDALFMIKTGEYTAYSNCLIEMGVSF